MLNDFLAEVKDPEGGIISPQRLSAALHLPLAELSRVTGLHRNTLRTRPGSPKVQSRLGVVAQVVATAAELTGDVGRAGIWFKHQPLAGFDNKTAEELVAAGHGQAVLDHLAILHHGGHA